MSAFAGQGDQAEVSPRHKPLLYRKISIPKPMLVTKEGRTFGGDLRIGDLDGDGRCDLLVYRCNHGAPRGAHMGGLKPSFLGAFDLEGKPLWSQGAGGNQPSRPMSVAVHDMAGDSAAEVICFWHRTQYEMSVDWRSLADVVVQIRDGRSGRVLREAAPPELTRRRMKDPGGSNWVHQRLLVANFRGTPTPRDFVAKLGDTYVAFDERLQVLWTYQTKWTEYSRCPAYIPAVGDLDGDGRDELVGGFFVLRPDGTPIWEKMLGRNMDSVAVAPWDAGRPRAICSGFGHVMDAQGKVILQLGPELVPHGQEVRVGDLLGNLPGPEMVLRYNGHRPDIYVVSSSRGAIVSRLTINPSPTNVGMEIVYWDGPDRPGLLYNGGWLWDLSDPCIANDRGPNERGQGPVPRRNPLDPRIDYAKINKQGRGLPLPGLPPPGGGKVHRMGFYHAIPADIVGDRREELVLWDPTAASVFIYTPGPLDADAHPTYHAGPRQYNPRLMD